MTQSKLEDFKNAFTTERAEIRDQLAKASQDSAVDASGDEVDQAAAISNLGLQTAILGRSKERLRQIDSALQRIADGTFGICTDCEEGIDERRLQAKPTAVLCLDCQEEHEGYARRHVAGASSEDE